MLHAHAKKIVSNCNIVRGFILFYAIEALSLWLEYGKTKGYNNR